MDILLVFGIAMLLLAAVVAVLGVRHGTVEIANDARAKETDAVVVSMPRGSWPHLASSSSGGGR